MKIVLLVIFSIYFTLKFVSAYISFTRSKSNKEYYEHFTEMLIASGLIFAFAKLASLMSEVG